MYSRRFILDDAYAYAELDVLVLDLVLDIEIVNDDFVKLDLVVKFEIADLVYYHFGC